MSSGTTVKPAPLSGKTWALRSCSRTGGRPTASKNNVVEGIGPMDDDSDPVDEFSRAFAFTPAFVFLTSSTMGTSF